ncbi:MAG: type II toxin-antitoxin system VapC family toxin [Proteobacteria bacterium]|nr:type II toxin-antitoxin system VapC family toxin [Pseudomonadota bacterium]
MKKVLLDTNGYSEYLTGNLDVFHAISLAENVFMSVIVLGELYAGFRGGSKYRQNDEILRKFLSKPTVGVLLVTEETSQIFGQTKNALKKSGTPIPINDVWIASQAIETGAVVITYDSHYEEIAGLRIWENLNSE